MVLQIPFGDRLTRCDPNAFFRLRVFDEVAERRNAVGVPADVRMQAHIHHAPALRTLFIKNIELRLVHGQNFVGRVSPAMRMRKVVDLDRIGLARRLGRDRTYLVDWPSDCKDANEVLVQHGEEKVRQCVEAARPYPVTGIYTFEDFGDEIDRLYREGVEETHSTGWPAVDLIAKVPAAAGRSCRRA